MSTEFSALSMDSMLHVRRSPVQEAGDGAEGMTAFFAHEANFAALGDSALERAQPELLKSLTRLVHQAEPLLPGMEETLDSLKEAFLELLRAKLAERRIDLDARLVLGLDGCGRFGLADGDHPRREELEALLAATPELEAAMREIARQSLLLRGLQDIGSAMGASRDGADGAGASLARCPAAAPAGQDTAYHVCLKGALSHFYFPGC